MALLCSLFSSGFKTRGFFFKKKDQEKNSYQLEEIFGPPTVQELNNT